MFVGHTEYELASKKEQGNSAETAVGGEGHLSQRSQSGRRQPLAVCTRFELAPGMKAHVGG